MGYYFIREPKFFREFSCKGPECPQNCCVSWGKIVWTNAEYENLCSLPLSDKHREEVEKVFVKEENDEAHDGFIWNLSLGAGNSCHFLTKEGLCSLQLTYGADCLSRTCRVYPRTGVFNSGELFLTCNLSCPEVQKFMLRDKDIMTTERRMVQFKGSTVQLEFNVEDAKTAEEYPLTAQRAALFDFFYELISKEEYPVEDCLILGGYAAKILGKYEGADDAKNIPETLSLIKEQLYSPKQTALVHSLSPDITKKKNIIWKLVENLYCDKFMQERLSSIIENELFDYKKYESGIEKFHALFKGREYYFRNIALNMFYELKMPLYLKEYNIFSNWLYLCAGYSMAMITASAAALNAASAEEITDALAVYDRTFSHDPVFAAKTIEKLTQQGISSPAQIALMLK